MATAGTFLKPIFIAGVAYPIGAATIDDALVSQLDRQTFVPTVDPTPALGESVEIARENASAAATAAASTAAHNADAAAHVLADDCVFLGDSLSATSASTWPGFFLADPAMAGVSGHNFAVGGYTLANVAADYAANVGGQRALRPAVTGRRGILFLRVGANDIIGANSATVATWKAAYTDFLATLRADGWFIVAFGIIPRGGYGSGADAFTTTARDLMNLHIESANWDRLIQLDRVFTNPADSRFYTSDGTHQNATAGKRIAQIAVAEMWGRGSQVAFTDPQTAAAYLYDDFSGAGNLAGTAPDTTGTALWVKLIGDQDTQRGGGVATSYSGGSADAISVGAIPGVVESKMLLAYSSSILVRVVDCFNFWQIQFRNGAVYLRKRVAGVDTDMGSGTTDLDTLRIVRFEQSGNSMRVLIDGVEKVVLVDATHASATGVGIFGFTGAVYHYIRATP